MMKSSYILFALLFIVTGDALNAMENTADSEGAEASAQLRQRDQQLQLENERLQKEIERLEQKREELRLQMERQRLEIETLLQGQENNAE